MSTTTTRKDIKTVAFWTLQSVQYDDGYYYYYNIEEKGQPEVKLNVSSLPGENNRMVHTVTYSPYSQLMNVEEAAKFVEQTQQALVAATEFQKAIDEAENNR